MLKQIFISSAVLIATMSQMVSSQSAIEAGSPDVLSTQDVKSQVLLSNLFGKTNVALDEIESNVEETVVFTFYNFLPIPIYVTFSGSNGTYNVTVPADAPLRDGNPISFDFEMPEGVYNLHLSTDYNYGPVTYGMSCRPSDIVTVDTETNNFTFSDVRLGINVGGCTSLDIWEP